jgi:peptidoglycan endopeptidase LytE
MRRLYLFIAIFILTIFISDNIYANTTYTIKKGDNPAKIAKKFKVSTQDIIKVNNLRPDNLKPGTKITIPSNKKESPHKNKLESTKLKAGHQLVVKKIGPKTYTVRKSDNIYKIAKRFDIAIDELKDINGLETDLLKPGQKILIEPAVQLDDLKTDKTKNYETIISQARIDADADIEKVFESKELSEIGLQDRLILFARKLLDIPYRFGGSSLLGIDCSAYVQKVYGLIGIDLPRSAREQFSKGNSVDKGELSIGDLVFFRTYASFPSHVKSQEGHHRQSRNPILSQKIYRSKKTY